MKILFDNCASPTMANTLGGYLQRSEVSVQHFRHIGYHTLPDIEWIRRIAEDDNETIVITGDGRIRKRKAEREAYRRAGIRGIVLSPAYQKTKTSRCCAVLVDRWDSLFQFTRQIQSPYLAELPINFSSKFKILPL